MLRWDPPSHYQGRLVEQDVTLHGVTIPADSRVILITGAANHDERRLRRSRVLRHPPRHRAARRLRVRHPPLRRGRAGPPRDPHRVRGAPGALPQLRGAPADDARVLEQRARPVEPPARTRSRRLSDSRCAPGERSSTARRATSCGSRTIDAPDAGPGEVRVRVDAITLNFNDIDGIHGRYRTVPVPAPYTPGMEVLGTVDAVGEGVDPALTRHAGRRRPERRLRRLRRGRGGAGEHDLPDPRQHPGARRRRDPHALPPGVALVVPAGRRRARARPC